ncbi:MAG: leucine-rich repeat protein [Saccharofermentans sp.]|nr:leucine-rich repeat protein [Saccharofermentans sp.]
MNKTSLKIATALLSVIFVLAVLPSVKVNAATSGTCGDNLTWTLDDTGVLTISGSGEINTSAFESRSDIKNVVIENGVTSIGDRAFYGCESLTNITIPDSVTLIGDNAFCFCSIMRGINIPESVTSIGDNAFSYTSLAYVDIPKSVTSIGEGAFNYCGGLKSVNISEGVTVIEDNTFHGCYFLTSVTIPKGVTSIGDDAFAGCQRLTSVVIPDSVTSIGDGAFSGCYSLTSVTIPNSVTSIGVDAFGGCTGLTSVIIPNKVTSIEISTFASCTSLESVTIPDSVTSIGEYSFWGCTSLTSIVIPSSVTSIGECSFYGCDSFTSVDIPQGVTSIGFSAFGGCSNLESVEIDKALYDKLDASVFKNCPKFDESKCVFRYKVTFVNEDGTVLYSDKVIYGGATAYPYSNPEKQADDQYTYAFSGWSDGSKTYGLNDELPEVTGDVTYTAQYKSTPNKYTVTFIDYDDTVISAAEYDYGTKAEDITVPAASRKADEQYTYTFNGWDKEIADVTGDATYTAQYSSAVNKYTVKFVDDEGNVLQSSDVAYGTAPEYSGATPAKAETDKATYTFSGWTDGTNTYGTTDKLPAITGEVTYKVMFAETLKPVEAETTIVKPVETPIEVAQPAEDVPAPITYTIGEVKGDGINSDIVIDVHRSEDDANCISYFRSVANNGVAMKNGEQYTAVTGSTIITIKSDYIKTLPAGEYTITVNFKDGSVSTTITVPERSGTSVPSTGESISPAVYVGVALILVSCATTGFILTKKRREEA